MGRQERQRQEIAAALARGHLARVVVLAREHLDEFPDDEVVSACATAASRAWHEPERGS